MRRSAKCSFIGVILTSATIFAFYILSHGSTTPSLISDLKDKSARSEVGVVEAGGDAREGAGDGVPKTVESPSSDGVSRETVSDRVREILSVGLPKVDEDVLGMEIGAIVRPATNKSFLENRVLAKLQGLYRHRSARCVIRVAIHCSQEELCIKLSSNPRIRLPGLLSWQEISCVGSLLPCDIERRFALTMTPDIMSTSDVVIFGMVGGAMSIDKMMALRPPGQLWVFMTIESPLYRQRFVPTEPGNPYNLTAFYTHDSDLYAPYGHFQRTPLTNPPQLQNKTKLMAWMASHCEGLPWKRTEFMKYLKQHIDIDIYGKCGGTERVAKEDMLTVLQQYKFYFALENNECREYITEKVSGNSFKSGAVPIVYGARPEDYARIFPVNSYIHLQDFDSVGHFVDFIQALHNDADKYKRYFDWQKEFTVRQFSIARFIRSPPEVTLCYLVRKLVYVSVYPETSWKNRVSDFGAWLRGQCPVDTTRKVLGFSVHDPTTQP